jgi:hypothetical protein
MKSEFPREVYEHLNHIITVLLPHISKVTPASRGMTENSQQSGYLYKLMKMQTDVQSYTIYFGLRQFWNEVYESYLMQAALTYSNEGIPRKFSSPGVKESITLNEPITLPDGRKGIRNDVRQLKKIRHKVIVSEVQQSPTKNLEDLQVIGEFMKGIPQTKLATINYLSNKMTQKIDSFSEEDKEILEALGDKELEVILEQLEVQKAQATLQKIGLQNQLAQAQAQMQPQPPQQPPQGGAAPGQGMDTPIAGVPPEGGDPAAAQQIQPGEIPQESHNAPIQPLPGPQA